MNNKIIYKKYDENENFMIGDLVSILPTEDIVTRSCTKHYKREDKLVIGICTNIIDNKIEVTSKGIVDVNVCGLVCIGDKLTTSDKEGKAKAIKYSNDDTRIYDIRSVGKVIGLYNDYNKVKVLLDLE